MYLFRGSAPGARFGAFRGNCLNWFVFSLGKSDVFLFDVSRLIVSGPCCGFRENAFMFVL